MKKKNKQKFASEEEPRQPQGPAQDSNFSLEEILREFGGGENAPAQNPPEAIPQSVQLDPALQSPIPRHRTVDPDPETQRPNVEHTLPERHIPPRPAEAPDASQATPIAAPRRSKPLLRSLPPRKSHAQRAVIPLATKAVRFPNSG